MPSFEIVAAAENNSYFLWQAALFHYSCLTYQRQTPIIVVHTSDGDELLPGFTDIVRCGGRIQRAPNWRSLHSINYPPRNTISTLKHVQTDADYIVLCDADMIFHRAINFTELPVGHEVMTFDRVNYLFADWPEYQPIVDDACLKAEVPPQWMREQAVSGGVPHIIPRARRDQFADEWLRCIDFFPTQEPCKIEEAGAVSRGVHQGLQQYWLSIMWAALLMVYRIKLRPVLTDLCALNTVGDEILPNPAAPELPMLHYCYSGKHFDKSRHDPAAKDSRNVWDIDTVAESLNGTVCRQLREAREFYGFDKKSR